MNYFVTAIGTDSGKTLVSAILCQALGADYWKPVQAGYPRDLETVQKLVCNPNTRFHPEAFLLNTPASPHAAAKFDGVSIHLHDFKCPRTNNNLVIEGAGGCLVPINASDFIIDLVPLFEAQVVLVSNLYLGSINHTLLTVELLRRRNLPIHGIIFNGMENQESEDIILRHAKAPCMLRVNREEKITQEVVNAYAQKLHQYWGL